MYNVAIIGYGGIGHVHAASYRELEQQGRAKLVAVFDKCEEAFTTKTDINISEDNAEKPTFNAYTDLDTMLANEQIDVIDICLPTQLHKELSVAMLGKGYHVMCEKPMATTYEDCMAMLDAAKKAGKRLMIGQCLHFFPEYEYLKEVADDGRFGGVKSVYFERLSAPPTWCRDNWNSNLANFGSCLHDMAIHDIDMAQYLFGPPDEVFCKTKDGFGQMDGATALMMYDRFTVTVVSDRSLVNFPFTYGYRVSFEKATLVCQNGDVTVYPWEGKAFKPEIESKDGYTGELDHFLDVASGQRDHGKNHVRSAAETVRIIRLLAESAAEGGVKKKYISAEMEAKG